MQKPTAFLTFVLIFYPKLNTYISLLRGINVGGHRKIAMADLKKMYQNLGFTAIQTYIQSGNITFAAQSNDIQALSHQIQQAIAEFCGFEVIVMLRTTEAMRHIAQQNPFLKQDKSIALDKLHIIFLTQIADPNNLKNINPDAYLPDKFEVIDKEIYLYCPNGYGKTKLTNDFFERKLKISATTRNQRTVNALNDMIANTIH